MRIDYYPLVSRAVSSLEVNNPENRAALFERVRVLLINQLRNRQPPASNSDIARQRAALEHAIRRVELASSTSSSISGSRQKTLTRTIKRLPQRVYAVGESASTTLSVHASKLTQRFLATVEILKRAIKKNDLFIKSMPSPILVSPGVALLSLFKLELFPTKSSYKSTVLREGDNLSANADGSRFLRNLVGIQLLDGLMLEAAKPLSSESAARDARTVLRWLGVDNTKEISPEHYDQFACAVQNYITECQNQSVRLSPATYCARSALNDDVRGVLNRLLEREQAERVVDDTLTSFARLWIRLFVALNLFAVIVLLLAAPTLASGLAKLLEFYSPFNIATWIVEAVALSPALFAIFWKNQRLSRLSATPEATFYLNPTKIAADTGGLGSYRLLASGPTAG
jgi:hypothetical protein